MVERLRVSLVEDSEDDAALLLRELKLAGYDVTHDRVFTAEGIEASFAKNEWDLVISDHGMAAFSGTEALQSSGASRPISHSFSCRAPSARTSRWRRCARVRRTT